MTSPVSLRKLFTFLGNKRENGSSAHNSLVNTFKCFMINFHCTQSLSGRFNYWHGVNMERQLVSWRFPVAKCPGFQTFSMKIHSNNILLICVVAQMPVIRAQLTNLILKMVGGCANQEAGICTVLQHVRHHCKTN